TVIGDPKAQGTRMGALVSAAQRQDVLAQAAQIGSEAERVFGDPDAFAVNGADPAKGAFLPPMLFHCPDPDTATRVHDTEAFGPVATVMGYGDLDHAIALVNRGQGSLVASVITHDADVARHVALGAGAFHGRLYFNNRDSMGESTGHGSPLPHMVHGGPGRAGGGEEMGGIRGVLHYMQRTAIQGSPDILSAIGQRWVPGATEVTGPAHPFRRGFHDLAIGETLHSPDRTITDADIAQFAAFTGDTFYAHMDDAAAARNPFFPGRVAHGYLLLSFAAGLFVDPDEGPVLANTGLDGLRFLKPVQAGDAIQVRLTVKAKTPRNDSYGEVRWHVTLTNQDRDLVAEYDLLTMNAYSA
ncbi:MAG: aldehyde dehydrogenase family protein, partial [Pseudomonadota bacterium]